jgi:hypothetical protein
MRCECCGAERHADENEPVTEERMRLAGAETMKSDPRWQQFAARWPLDRGHLAVSVAVDGHVSVAKVGGFGETTYLIEGPSIRWGQVWRLAAALGVPLRAGAGGRPGEG